MIKIWVCRGAGEGYEIWRFVKSAFLFILGGRGGGCCSGATRSVVMGLAVYVNLKVE